MKTVKFTAALSRLVLSGEKTSTWRLFDDKNLSDGDELSLVVSETLVPFARAKIVSVASVAFRDLSESDWEGHERFESEAAMYRTYEGYYGRPVGPETIVKIIKFRLVAQDAA